MPLYLDTRGKASVAVGICDRCSRKFPLGELMADRNSPGLRVCREDNDALDPWRLPARRTEDITLRYPRPDESLTFVSEDEDLTYAILTDTGVALLTASGETLEVAH